MYAIRSYYGSAFVAMNELQLLLNKDYNEFVVKEYGECYRNPLNAVIYLPLLPAYSKVGNIVNARKEMDDMVVDIVITSYSIHYTKLYEK